MRIVVPFTMEANRPSGVVFGHCNRDYAKLQHFRVDHKAVGLRDVGSKYKIAGIKNKNLSVVFLKSR